MSSVKRTSLKQAKSPLDELFKKTRQIPEEFILRDKDDSIEDFKDFVKKIRKRKNEQKKEQKEAEKRVENAREKARKTGKKIKRTTSLILYGYQHDWLDMKRIESGKSDGKRISKAEIIRSLVDVVVDLSVNLFGVKNEEEIAQRIKEAINKK